MEFKLNGLTLRDGDLISINVNGHNMPEAEVILTKGYNNPTSRVELLVANNVTSGGHERFRRPGWLYVYHIGQNDGSPYSISKLELLSKGQTIPQLFN